LGIGDWGLGIGPNPQSPIPNPQSPTWNYFLNQSLFKFIKLTYINNLLLMAIRYILCSAIIENTKYLTNKKNSKPKI
jgi:hypothetical protein